MAELLHKAQKYMNIKDDVSTKEMASKRKRDERTSYHLDRKKETQSTRHIIDKKKSLPNRGSKFTDFTPLVMPIRKVFYPNWLANVVMVKKSNGK